MAASARVQLLKYDLKKAEEAASFALERRIVTTAKRESCNAWIRDAEFKLKEAEDAAAKVRKLYSEIVSCECDWIHRTDELNAERDQLERELSALKDKK